MGRFLRYAFPLGLRSFSELLCLLEQEEEKRIGKSGSSLPPAAP
jgi:hypothetical protein